MQIVIETTALTRRFGDLTAVDKLNLTVEASELFGLLGPNGTGKTTVIEMLTTLLPPTSGEAKVAGFDVRRKAARVRAETGYVPQLVSVDGTLTGYGNLLIFAKLYGVPRRERQARIAAALAGVGVLALLGAVAFSTLSLIAAWIVKTRERFMGIGQALTMPLFFACNAV